MTRKKKQLLCEENLRHNEYYGMQDTFDNLYAASKNGEVFTDLMSIVLQRENILLAYRNIKKNTGSKTCGTDKLTIRDIGKCSPDEVVEKVRFIVNGSEHGYRPKPVRRKEIPKPYDPSKTRPLGIPCIWDRLIQQCIKQVMEPVCEAKFSENSYGFRPNRCCEMAIQKVLEYKDWRNFQKVIDKAVLAANNSVSSEVDWIVEINKPIKTGKGKEEIIKDYKLSRYICYLIVQNADPSKEVVALGQTYFAIQTRKQEITEQEYDSLSDDEKNFIKES